MTAAKAEVTAPDSVVAGARFDVSWSAPIAPTDIVTIVPAGSDEGTIGEHLRVRDYGSGELTAPGDPGLYEVRYVLDEGRGTLAAHTVEVTAAKAEVTAPDTVVAGARFEVSWSAPISPTDIVTIVPAGADEGTSELSARARGSGELPPPAIRASTRSATCSTRGAGRSQRTPSR